MKGITALVFSIYTYIFEKGDKDIGYQKGRTIVGIVPLRRSKRSESRIVHQLFKFCLVEKETKKNKKNKNWNRPAAFNHDNIYGDNNK
jgi:hypothetical protein